MVVTTRLENTSSIGQDQEAMLFIWNGSSTGASLGIGVGSDAILEVKPYKSSFVVVTRAGEVLYFNGGGFQRLALFPVYNTNEILGDPQDNNANGQAHLAVDGDNILTHIGNELQPFGMKQDKYIKDQPAGVWCFNPKVGLHHKYSLSNSYAYIFAVTNANINTTTDTFTISSGTVPQTGNIIRMSSSNGVGGVTLRKNYYIIKVTDTSFKIALTKEQALAGVAVDLTSTSSGTHYFMAVDLIDYGITRYDTAGDVSIHGYKTSTYTDIIAGGTLPDKDLTNIQAVCTAVPYLPNIGLLETPKIFSQGDEDIRKSISIGYKPLNAESKIVIYARTKDVLGLPISTVNDGCTYTGKNNVYTTRDI